MFDLADESSQETSFTKPISPATIRQKQANYIVGILLLLVVVFLWTASNFVTQALFQDGYAKPFLLTYLSTSSFALYLLPVLIRQWRNGRGQFWQIHWSRSNVWVNISADTGYQPLVAGNSGSNQGHDVEEGEPTAPEGLPALTTRETVNLAFAFCLLWFIANWSINAALRYTSVASATILSSMSGFFTLGMGRLFLMERLTSAKIGAVVTSFGGVILVSLSDSAPASPAAPSVPFDGSSMLILGDLLAFGSALFYALYVTLLKVRVRSESRIDMQLFFGFVGLFNILTCWLLGLFLHLVGVEPFELPTTKRAVGAIIISMFITLISDYLYVLAMLKTSPIVVTVGLSLTIPLAVLGDLALGKSTTVQVMIGAFVVVVSFIAVGMDDAKLDDTKREELHAGTRA